MGEKLSVPLGSELGSGNGDREEGEDTAGSLLEVGRRLGDWSWRRGRRVKISCLIPWPVWPAGFQEVLMGVGGWGKKGIGRVGKIVGDDLQDPLEWEQGVLNCS